MKSKWLTAPGRLPETKSRQDLVPTVSLQDHLHAIPDDGGFSKNRKAQIEEPLTGNHGFHSFGDAEMASQGFSSSSSPGSQSDLVDAAQKGQAVISDAGSNSSNQSDDSFSQWLEASKTLPHGADPLAELAKLTPDLASLLSDLNEAGGIQEEDTEGALSSVTPLIGAHGNTG